MEALHPRALDVVLRDGARTVYSRALWNEGAHVKCGLTLPDAAKLLAWAESKGVVGSERPTGAEEESE
jgi:hypothetical protein